jgi:cation transport regulator ChaB
VSGGARSAQRETNNQTQQRETPHSNSNTSIVKTAVGTALGTAAGLGLAGAGAYALLKHNKGAIIKNAVDIALNQALLTAKTEESTIALNKIVTDAVTEAIKTVAGIKDMNDVQPKQIPEIVDDIIQRAINKAINTAGQKETVNESLKNIIRNAVTTAVATVTDKGEGDGEGGSEEEKKDVPPGQTRARFIEVGTEIGQSTIAGYLPTIPFFGRK